MLLRVKPPTHSGNFYGKEYSIMNQTLDADNNIFSFPEMDDINPSSLFRTAFNHCEFYHTISDSDKRTSQDSWGTGTQVLNEIQPPWINNSIGSSTRAPVMVHTQMSPDEASTQQRSSNQSTAEETPTVQYLNTSLPLINSTSTDEEEQLKELVVTAPALASYCNQMQKVSNGKGSDGLRFFRPQFNSEQNLIGIDINNDLFVDQTSYSTLAGTLMKCCTIYMPQFWDLICVPKLTCQNSNLHHIKLLKESIKENPQISMGSISVSPEYSDEQGVFFQIVDGVHRFRSIVELREEGI